MHCSSNQYSERGRPGRHESVPMHIERTPGNSAFTHLRPEPSVPAEEHALLRTDVAARLSRVRGDMSSEAFDALVDDICAMKVRWARQSTVRRDD
jgi:hypothetical protein